MRASFTQLYVHYVWATCDRLPIITPDIQKQVYGAIIRECEQLKCTVIAIGGIEDHVHSRKFHLLSILNKPTIR